MNIAAKFLILYYLEKGFLVEDCIPGVACRVLLIDSQHPVDVGSLLYTWLGYQNKVIRSSTGTSRYKPNKKKK